MPEPKEMLELRLEHAGTPERVARATRMLADVLRPVLGLEAAREEQPGDENEPAVTIVVGNYDMRVTVRVWNPTYETHVEAISNFIHTPDIESDFSSEVAKALADYAKSEIEYQPTFWRLAKGAPQVLRTVDEQFVEEVRAVIGQRARRNNRVRGAAYLQTKIYAIGRKNDDAPTKARILVPDGSYLQVVVEPEWESAFTEAYKAAREFRVKLVGDWIREGGRLELSYDTRTLRATGIDERIATGDGLRVVNSPNALSRDELRSMLDHLRGEPEDEVE